MWKVIDSLCHSQWDHHCQGFLVFLHLQQFQELQQDRDCLGVQSHPLSLEDLGIQEDPSDQLDPASYTIKFIVTHPQQRSLVYEL